MLEKLDVVVLDGYISSTKDITLTSRSVRISQTVEIDKSYTCTTDKNEFLTIYTNKNWKLTVSKLFSALVMLALPSSKLHYSMKTDL